MSANPPGFPRKLTDAQVREIREWYAARMAMPSGFDLAKKYGVDNTLIYRVGRGIAYKTSHRNDRG